MDTKTSYNLEQWGHNSERENSFHVLSLSKEINYLLKPGN